jgi:hypothetical protein
MNVTQIFCDVDDFCQGFIPDWEKTQLEPDEKTKTRARERSVCESEIITLVVCYHLSGYRTFKWFYQRLVQKYWLADFPGLPSYNRFVELMSDVRCPDADCRVYAESLRYGERHCIYRYDVFVRLQKHPHSTPQNFQGCGWARQVVNGLVLWL